MKKQLLLFLFLFFVPLAGMEFTDPAAKAQMNAHWGSGKRLNEQYFDDQKLALRLQQEEIEALNPPHHNSSRGLGLHLQSQHAQHLKVFITSFIISMALFRLIFNKNVLLWHILKR